MAVYINNIIHIPVELLNDDDHNGDLKCDVYSFTFFMYRMFSNSFIFPQQMSGYRCFESILRGNRPQRPDNISNCYWKLIEKCWKDNPGDRPSFEEITNFLKDDKYAIEEFRLTTDLDQLHQYAKQN